MMKVKRESLFKCSQCGYEKKVEKGEIFESYEKVARCNNCNKRMRVEIVGKKAQTKDGMYSGLRKTLRRMNVIERVTKEEVIEKEESKGMDADQKSEFSEALYDIQRMRKDYRKERMKYMRHRMKFVEDEFVIEKLKEKIDEEFDDIRIRETEKKGMMVEIGKPRVLEGY